MCGGEVMHPTPSRANVQVFRHNDGIMERLLELRRQIILAALLGGAAITGTEPASAGPKIAVDVTNGRVVAAEDAFVRWYPASLTKLMTAYVTFRAVKAGEIAFETPIMMTAAGARLPPSKMFFRVGARFTLDSAMKYIMVKSANDVTVAIAEAISGSEEAFVARMNEEAARLGMRDTRFINPNGLPGAGQQTTAHDMAVLALALRREFPAYAHYFSYEGFLANGGEHHNYNILLGRYNGADGMKTGFICASGFNLVSSATRGGRTALAVVLGAKDQETRAEDAVDLLEKVLSGSGTGGITLEQMVPAGTEPAKVADVSEAICSEEARKQRYEGRDVEGQMKIDSPYIAKLERAPRLTQAPFAQPGDARFHSPLPLPIARPELPGDREALATALNAPAKEVLRPGIPLAVPVPQPRPSL